MRIITTLSIIAGCIMGFMGAYLWMSPVINKTARLGSMLQQDAISIITLRGLVESVDIDGRTLTIRVSYPGFPQQSAPFRIPFDAAINYDNGTIEKTGDKKQDAISGRHDITTVQVGQLATMRVLRQPGTFKVYSLITSVPRLDNL